MIGTPSAYESHTKEYTTELSEAGFKIDVTYIHGVKIIKAKKDGVELEYVEVPELVGHLGHDMKQMEKFRLIKTRSKIMNENSGNQREMPKYKCHKKVWALKIGKIEKAKQENRETDGSAIITPVEEGYAPFRVEHDYLRKHNPQVGGYYVVYKDGYKSYSPAQAFEKGYTLIEQ
jgi:hypothetical protein